MHLAPLRLRSHSAQSVLRKPLRFTQDGLPEVLCGATAEVTSGRVHDEKRRSAEMSPLFRGPIYEPRDSSFRPWTLTTLIAFLVGRFFGRMFRNRRRNSCG